MCDTVIRGAFLSQVLRIRHVCKFREEFVRYAVILMHRFDECGLLLDDMRQVARKLQQKYTINIYDILDRFVAEKAQLEGNYVA
jgi:hypothetical protein